MVTCVPAAPHLAGVEDDLDRPGDPHHHLAHLVAEEPGHGPRHPRPAPLLLHPRRRAAALLAPHPLVVGLGRALLRTLAQCPLPGEGVLLLQLQQQLLGEAVVELEMVGHGGGQQAVHGRAVHPLPLVPEAGGQVGHPRRGLDQPRVHANRSAEIQVRLQTSEHLYSGEEAVVRILTRQFYKTALQFGLETDPVQFQLNKFQTVSILPCIKPTRQGTLSVLQEGWGWVLAAQLHVPRQNADGIWKNLTRIRGRGDTRQGHDCTRARAQVSALREVCQMPQFSVWVAAQVWEPGPGLARTAAGADLR